MMTTMISLPISTMIRTTMLMITKIPPYRPHRNYYHYNNKRLYVLSVLLLSLDGSAYPRCSASYETFRFVLPVGTGGGGGGGFMEESPLNVLMMFLLLLLVALFPMEVPARWEGNVKANLGGVRPSFTVNTSYEHLGCVCVESAKE